MPDRAETRWVKILLVAGLVCPVSAPSQERTIEPSVQWTDAQILERVATVRAGEGPGR